MGKYFEIKEEFEKLSDLDNSINMSKYMRNTFDFYGIKTDKRRLVYKDFLKDKKEKGIIDWNLLKKSWEDDKREFQYFACDYLDKMKEFLTYDDIKNHLYYFAKTKQRWDSIDRLDRIIGFIGLKDKRVDDLMEKWSKDDDFWLRRIAIDHQIGRKELTNKDLLSKIIKNNFYSDEFFINKAIGWSLREYSKIDSDFVINFVKENDEKMSDLSKREALKRIKRGIDARREKRN